MTLAEPNPATIASERPVASRLLALVRRSAPTISGTALRSDTPETVEHAPATTASPNSSATRAPDGASSSRTSAVAWVRSAPTISRLRGIREASAPARTPDATLVSSRTAMYRPAVRALPVRWYTKTLSATMLR